MLREFKIVQMGHDIDTTTVIRCLLKHLAYLHALQGPNLRLLSTTVQRTQNEMQPKFLDTEQEAVTTGF